MSYIQPEYEEIENQMKPFLIEHNVDTVTFGSLIRGCVKVSDPDLPNASVAVITNGISSGKSVKPSNISVDLDFALQSIFNLKQTFDSDGIWLIASLLQTILLLSRKLEIKLDANDSAVLFCIYRLRCATQDEIETYLKELVRKGTISDIQFDSENVKKTLGKLEKIGTIALENGKYSLRETVVIERAPRF